MKPRIFLGSSGKQAKLVLQIRHARHGDHRLWNDFGERQEARAQTARENYCLHASFAGGFEFICASIL